MIWRKVAGGLIGCGVLMIAFGISTLPAQGATPERPLAQPSPRPTLVPTTAVPTAVPTAPAPPPKEDSHSEPAPTAVPMGHITGTIIDLSTGAPAPGVTVNVGGLLISSDANGNYDHWLPVGTYSVSLVLMPEQGMPAQDAQQVELKPWDTSVLHLSFRSPAPGQTASAALAPTVAGAAPTRGQAPARLPVTAGQPTSAWLWLALGVMLLAAGSALGIGGRLSRALPLAGDAGHGGLRRPASRADDARLLAALLMADARAQSRSGAGHNRAAAPKPRSDDEALLAALLELRQRHTDRAV